jgi:hypothetical protein
MFEKIASPKDSNRLAGVFITGESNMKTNNSTNIRKNSNSFLGLKEDCSSNTVDPLALRVS